MTITRMCIPWPYSSINLLWYWVSSVRDGTSSIFRCRRAISRFLRASNNRIFCNFSLSASNCFPMAVNLSYGITLVSTKSNKMRTLTFSSLSSSPSPLCSLEMAVFSLSISSCCNKETQLKMLDKISVAVNKCYSTLQCALNCCSCFFRFSFIPTSALSCFRTL